MKKQDILQYDGDVRGSWEGRYKLVSNLFSYYNILICQQTQEVAMSGSNYIAQLIVPPESVNMDDASTLVG